MMMSIATVTLKWMINTPMTIVVQTCVHMLTTHCVTLDTPGNFLMTLQGTPTGTAAPQGACMAILCFCQSNSDAAALQGSCMDILCCCQSNCDTTASQGACMAILCCCQLNSDTAASQGTCRVILCCCQSNYDRHHSFIRRMHGDPGNSLLLSVELSHCSFIGHMRDHSSRTKTRKSLFEVHQNSSVRSFIS